jgi:hypothetical protein
MYDPVSGVWGVIPRHVDQTNDVMATMDHEEDFTLGAANINLESGHVPSGEHRNKYYARAIVSLDDSNVATVLYRIFGDDVNRTIVLGPGQSFTFAKPCRILIGSNSGSSAGDYKIMWKDRFVYDGVYGGRTKVTLRP